MSEIVISAENLSKSYLVGHRSAPRERYTALRDTIGRGARAFARKALDLLQGRQLVPGDEIEEYWALKDVCFDVRRGEVLGIIGRNGAGKSTLLKILSRITEPTRGRVRIFGRVSSLLEIGTGFHPELTGRENIFLNGAILGMSKADIRRRFDEIVAFAGTEKFLDTPVKRYSSGMFVRLAFAVAAHLELDILVVDEVLAVGDIGFQKKCIGKMAEVAEAGRTVLFVSHNLAAVKSLTTRGLVLDGGRVMFLGKASEALDRYIAHMAEASTKTQKIIDTRGTHTAILDARLVDERGEPAESYIAGQPMRLKVVFETDGTAGLSLDAMLQDQNGNKIALFSDYQFYGRTLPTMPGRYECRVEWEPLWLASGTYTLDVITAVANVAWDHYVRHAITFVVPYCNPGGESWDYNQGHSFGFIALARKETGFDAMRPLDR